MEGTAGSCLFHAVALCLIHIGRAYQTHDKVRQSVVNYLVRHRRRDDGTDRATFIDPEYYSTNWDVYLAEIRRRKAWGDEICLQACHELFSVNIVLYPETGSQIRKYQSDRTSEWPTIHLGIKDRHYYAIFPLSDDPDEQEQMRHQLIGMTFTNGM